MILVRALAHRTLLEADDRDNLRGGREWRDLAHWNAERLGALLREVDAVLREDRVEPRDALAALDLLAWLLQANPEERPASCEQVLAHPFLAGERRSSLLLPDSMPRAGNWRMTPTHIAASLGEPMTDLLHDVNSVFHPQRQTPLHLACESKRREAVETILQHAATDPNVADATGDTALLSSLRPLLHGATPASADEVARRLAVLEMLCESKRVDLSVKDAANRSAVDLARGSPHGGVRELFARKERELRERETLLALDARPPRPFDVATFDRLWSGATREECERALFRLLDEWAMARPCATAAVDEGVKLCDVMGDDAGAELLLDTKTMHDKKRYCELYVFRLSLWTARGTLVVPLEAALKDTKGHRVKKLAISDSRVLPGLVKELVLDTPIPADATNGSELAVPVHFLRLQAMASKTNVKVFDEMFAHRDEVVRGHVDGGKFAELQKFGSVDQPLAPGLADTLSKAVKHDSTRRDSLDTEVLVPTVREFGLAAVEDFKASLLELLPHARLLNSPHDLHKFEPEATLISVAPVKESPRMKVKVKTCKGEAVERGDEEESWPHVRQLGDVLRGMIVCGYGQYREPMLVWDSIRERYGVRDGRGRCCPNFAANNRPPDMCECSQPSFTTSHLESAQASQPGLRLSGPRFCRR